MLLVASGLALAMCPGCSDELGDLSDVTTTTATPAAADAVTVPPDAGTPQAAVAARIAAIDPSGLVLGDAFNRQFLGVQLRAVGLDETEAACVADAVANQLGASFASTPAVQLMSGTMRPDVMMSCVPMERVGELAAGGGAVDTSRVPAATLRAVFTELASAGYEEAGLTAVEATCLADAVVGTIPDAELAATSSSLDFGGTRITTALPGCVTPDRLAQLSE